MTSQSKEASANSKNELLVEAIEEFCNAVFTARSVPDGAPKRVVSKAVLDVTGARAQLNEALHEFTLPMLRAIEGGPQPYVQGLRDADKPKCGKCRAQAPCNSTCSHWAAAVRAVVANAKSGTTD